MSEPSPGKKAIWRKQAAAKGAIVPRYFEVFVDHAVIVCGNCGRKFSRNLIFKQNNPTFVCPEPKCRKKNWIPLKYDVK